MFSTTMNLLTVFGIGYRNDFRIPKHCFQFCHEAINNRLLRSTDLHSMKSSDRTDTASSSGYFILPITCNTRLFYFNGRVYSRQFEGQIRLK